MEGDSLNVPTVSAPQDAATMMMGPSQIAYQAQVIIFAFFVSQFYNYCKSGEMASHNKAGRVALWVSLVLNFVYTALCVYENYIAAVSQDRTYDKLSNGTSEWNVLPLLSGLIAALTEGFLAIRAANLIPNKTMRLVFSIWMGLLIAAVLVGSAGACATGVLYALEDATILFEWNTAAAIWLWSSTAADLSISLACAYGLYSRVRGFNDVTDSLLRRLISIVVRTAAYTAVVSLAGAVMLSVYKDDDLRGFISLALWVPLAGLYALSLFTFSAGSRRAVDSRLNSHSPAYLPHIRDTPQAGALKGDFHRPAPKNGGSGERISGVFASAPLQIQVQRQEEVTYDDRDEEDSIELTKYERDRKRRLDRSRDMRVA